MRRLGLWIAAVGSAVSQLVQTVIIGALFMVDAAPAPDPDETLSAVTGRRQQAGVTWARIAAPVIDAIMFAPDGFKWHHCKRAAVAHAANKMPLNRGC